MGDDTLQELVDNKVSGIIYKPYDINNVVESIGKVIAGQRVIPEIRPWKNITQQKTPKKIRLG